LEIRAHKKQPADGWLFFYAGTAIEKFYASLKYLYCTKEKLSVILVLWMKITTTAKHGNQKERFYV